MMGLEFGVWGGVCGNAGAVPNRCGEDLNLHSNPQLWS